MKLRNVLLLSVSALFGACAGAGDDPADTTEAFFSAMKDGDYEKCKELATADSAKSIPAKQAEEDTEKFEFADLTIGDAQIDGDTAEVPVSFKVMGQDMNIQVPLKKEGDSWKVNANKAFSSIQNVGGKLKEDAEKKIDELKDAIK